MNIRGWLVAVAGMMLAACAAPEQAPVAVETTAVKEAYSEALNTDAAACSATNGEIRPVCRMGKPMCVIAFKDAGKSCADSSQCGGRCTVEIGAPAGQPATGTCAPNNDPCGCFQLVEKGIAQPGLCAD